MDAPAPCAAQHGRDEWTLASTDRPRGGERRATPTTPTCCARCTTSTPPALWAYVVGLTNGDRAKAQDVVQETMLRAWRNPQVLDQRSGSARGWLFTVAKRIVIDDWRTARQRRETVTDEVPESGRGRRRPTAPSTASSWSRRMRTLSRRAPRRAARVLLPRVVGEPRPPPRSASRPAR